jgi:hypothetical protein
MAAGESESTPKDAGQGRSQDPKGYTVFRRGSIGDLSSRVGCDVRDLIMSGYGLDEIYEGALGKCTLEELLQRGPRRRRRKGR